MPARQPASLPFCQVNFLHFSAPSASDTLGPFERFSCASAAALHSEMDLFQLPNCASFLAYTLSRSSPSVHPAVKTFSKACCGGDAGKHCDLSIECSAQHQRCLGGARHRLALLPLHRLALLPLHPLYLSEGLSKSSDQVEAYIASSQ